MTTLVNKTLKKISDCQSIVWEVVFGRGVEKGIKCTYFWHNVLPGVGVDDYNGVAIFKVPIVGFLGGDKG